MKVIDGGKLVIPAAFRRALGVAPGDTVLAEMVDGELRIRSLALAVQRAQAIVRASIPEGVSLSEELIDDRRAEAAIE